MALTILVSNIILAHRTGTEVVVEQLADGLRQRGHRPIVFAPQLGPLAQEMRLRGHLVTDNPAALTVRPDIIHGHHTGPTMAAIAAHPGVPALFVCHDASAAFDTLPRHPRLRCLFAVDERCRARLVADGAAAGDVELLPNAVALGRIPPRQPLPQRPRTAAVFAKGHADLTALRSACAQAGIALEEYGSAVGRMVERPEEIFARTDLVFATARTALEAAAAGAGVVVCDTRGCAGFLTRANAEAWLPWNLGAGTLAQPSDLPTLVAAIASWDAAEAEAASALVRKERDLEPWLDRLEGIYASMTEVARPTDAQAEAVAIGTFIAGWVPHFDQAAPWRRLAEHVSVPPLGSPLDGLDQRVMAIPAALTAQLDRLESTVLGLRAGVESELSDARAGVTGVTSAMAEIRDGMATAMARMDPENVGVSALRGIWRRSTPVALRASLYRLRQGAAKLRRSR